MILAKNCKDVILFNCILFCYSAISSLLDDVETKYDDIRTSNVEVIQWNKKNDFTDEEDDQVSNTAKS